MMIRENIFGSFYSNKRIKIIYQVIMKTQMIKKLKYNLFKTLIKWWKNLQQNKLNKHNKLKNLF